MNPTEIIFYIFSVLLILASLAVILARNPVHSVLCLVFAFVMTAGIWLIMQAEFLGLVLILVYVGAVMTLFLFIVMMLNLDQLPDHKALKKYWPFAVLILSVLVGLTLYVISPQHFLLVLAHKSIKHTPNASNIKMIGSVLYTHYVYALQVVAVILLVSIIAAISLAFSDWNGHSKRQSILKQVQVTARERVRLLKDIEGDKI